MHWITMSGIVLIAAGIFLAFFGQNFKNRFDDKHLQREVSEKTLQIDELTSGRNELLNRIDEYQKNLSEKDKIIQQLEAPFGRPNVIDTDQVEDVQEEAVTQVIPELGFHDEIAQARSLCEEGMYDEAYKIADDLKQKNPDFGLAYFILGSIEIQKQNYKKGEDLLKKAVQLGLFDEDKSWAFHNLGIAAFQRQKYTKAKGLLQKAIDLNSNMEKSREALELVNDLLRKKRSIAKVKSLCEEGKYDDAYRIAEYLKQKNPEFGMPYFILGSIEIHKKYYDKGEELLKIAIQLGLPDEDKAWAFHNLAVVSIRKKDYEEARGFLEKAVSLSPNMEESKKILDSLDSLQRKEKHEKDEEDSEGKEASKSKEVSKGKEVSGSKKVSKSKRRRSKKPS